MSRNEETKKINYFIAVLSSCIFFVLGMTALIWVQQATNVLFLVFGCALLFIGIFNVLRFAVNKQKTTVDIFKLLYGVMAIAGAVLFFSRMQFILDFVSVLVALYIVIAAFIRMKDVRLYKKKTGNGVMAQTLLVLLELVVGIVCICGKMLFPDAILRFSGAMLVAYSVADIAALAIMMLGDRKNRKNAEEREDDEK